MTNYFVCTLGQASSLSREPKPYRTISEFLDFQAQYHAYLPAVGFPIPATSSEEWRYQVLTFGDVHRGTQIFAERLSRPLSSRNDPSPVALLCHSSSEFLFTWLALIRLGHPVLLIAPQCQPAAIVHLCRSCKVSVLLHDEAHRQRAQQTEKLAREHGETPLKSQPVPLDDSEDVFQIIKSQIEVQVSSARACGNDVAYLHHTSGTSSGLPKPIPQTHQGALIVLPRIPKTAGIASFTTTPLYHGGIADLFRCWTSNALIWLFPGKDVPITAHNICLCLEQANLFSKEDIMPKVEYFSSVPYVLQMMEADGEGLKWLQQMEIVGVGGAALPAEIGDRLVNDGVNLVSRFGSAECGFSLSSFRDFDTDKDWQYLRNYNPTKSLEFEPRDDGLAELVIKSGWPHMAKRNREDGSFTTADLFAPHPTHKDAWLYHSRADSQLTLITGKKFDPAPLEAALATTPHLDDVLIFGNGRPFPGALLLRSEESSDISDQELLAAIKTSVEKMNTESQDHARIPFHMLVPLPHQDKSLEKSSKGTILRRAAESRFETIINDAYEKDEAGDSAEVQDEDLPEYLAGLMRSITSQSDQLTEDMDLFSYGVDSIACMQLRTHLRHLIPKGRKDLPMSVIEDCGTIRRLSEYIIRKRHGEDDVVDEDEEKLMLDLVQKYSSFNGNQATMPATRDDDSHEIGEVIVLTGATGALGAHILNLMGKSDKINEIYCLVRGADEHAATERVSKGLQQRGLVDITSQGTKDTKVKILPAQLASPRLGLDDSLYTHLAQSATSIIHIAWTVNFRLKLRSFVKDNIAGVHNLISLALAANRTNPPQFTFCSSTASIINAPPNPSGLLPEHLSSMPSTASPLGYSQSKWVAEGICAAAHARTKLRGNMAVVRVGQLTGDSVTGTWNTKEAWPIMLSTAGVIGCLPDLKDERLDWLSVDVAAKAFLEIADVGSRTQSLSGSERQEDVPVFHVLNPHDSPTWTQMLHWLQKKSAFDIVSPKEWIEKLEEGGGTEHSSQKLLGLWKDAYGGDAQQQSGRERVKFDVSETQKQVTAIRDAEPLDEEFVDKMWDWIQKNVG